MHTFLLRHFMDLRWCNGYEILPKVAKAGLGAKEQAREGREWALCCAARTPRLGAVGRACVHEESCWKPLFLAIYALRRVEAGFRYSPSRDSKISPQFHSSRGTRGR